MKTIKENKRKLNVLHLNVFCINRTFSYIHSYTYIIGHYNPSVMITPLMLFVLILYISGGTYSLKSSPNDRFFWETFHGNFIYSQCYCQKSAERKSPKKYFSYFVLMLCCLAWNSNLGFLSNKPTHYLLDHGDFIFIQLFFLNKKKNKSKNKSREYKFYRVRHLTFFFSTSAYVMNGNT